MTLVIGGACQGKLDFAKKTFGVTDAGIFICTTEKIDFSKRCVYKVEEFTYGHPDPIGFFKANREAWEDSILIMEDFFAGWFPWERKRGHGGRIRPSLLNTEAGKLHRSVGYSAD